MSLVWMLILTIICVSCSKAEQQNDPYTTEDTEFEYTPPGPYYDEKDDSGS